MFLFTLTQLENYIVTIATICFLIKFFQRRFRKRYLCTRFFYTFFFCKRRCDVNDKKAIVFYVQRSLLNLQMTKFFLKIFLLIGVILVKNV